MDGIFTVTESQIVNAMSLIFNRVKVVVEPSGAVGLAAVLKGMALAQGGAEMMVENQEAQAAELLSKCLKVGVILCGGNIDLESKGFFQMKNWQPSV